MATDQNERDKIVVGMLGLCLGNPLVDALLEVAKLHGGRSGPWLDDLEQKALQGVRTISIEGASIDNEAAAYRIVLGTVEAYFSEARRRIDKPTD